MAQDALLRLVNLEPRELCNEAIVEKCRATRDLRSCGRVVQHVLTSCGHASLCAECSQRCDVCPICRVPMRKQESTNCLRLYDECLEAGLINSSNEEFRERDGHPNTDVQRLWSFFDVALENKLVSLICHYVSDVCMDDGAVSSNAIVSMLLDGTIVKDWCKKTFLHVTRSLRDIYNSGIKQMQSKLGALENYSRKLSGLAHVLESLDGPDVDNTSAPVRELQQLLEGIQRVSQHLEMMCWCASNQFLENMHLRYSTINNWRTAVRARRTAAQERAWPEHTRNAWQTSCGHSTTLFIDDAMSNVGYGKEHDDEFLRDNLELGSLRQGTATSSASFRRRETAGVQSAMHGLAVVYPPDNMRAAVDLLFLEATSDLILAKKAIFLYYLFDMHWPHCDDEWRRVLNDYLRTFDIPRHIMLESLLFYLLDDSSDAAVEEACRLLPEVVSSRIHPKVARVLLERQKPDAALDVLHSSSQDGGLRFTGSLSKPSIPSLLDAMTAVRVRLECGLLTEAFLHQRSHISMIKSLAMKDTASKLKLADNRESSNSRDWFSEMELLVGEICWLCIHKKLVDKMLELPWQADEENVIQKCLFEQATHDPASTAGNLLVVFYIMRCRTVEAYIVHKRLCTIEKSYIEQCGDEGKSSCVRNICAQRTLIVEKCIELLPEIQRHQLRSGALDCRLPLASMDHNKEVSKEEKCIDLLPEFQAHQVRSGALDGMLPVALMDHNKKVSNKQLDAKARVPIWSEQTAISAISASPHRALDDIMMPVGWGDFRQPSILHGKPFKASSGGSALFSPLDQPSFSCHVSRRNSGEGLMSPILVRKLNYNGESDTYSNAISKTVPISSEQTLVVSDYPRDIFNVGDRDPQISVQQQLASELQGANGCIGRVWSFDNGESSLKTSSMGLNMNKKMQRAEPNFFENGPSEMASGHASSLGFRQKESAAHDSRELSEEEKKTGVSRSLQGLNVRPRRQVLHSSPNGKRKAYDQLDVCQCAMISEVALDKSLGILNDDNLKPTSNELQPRNFPSETQVGPLRSLGNSGLRWQAEDGTMETPSHTLPTSKSKSLSHISRTIGGSRAFRNPAL